MSVSLAADALYLCVRLDRHHLDRPLTIPCPEMRSALWVRYRSRGMPTRLGQHRRGD
jgi:hypothetical protein